MPTKSTVSEWVVAFLQTAKLSKRRLLQLLFSFQNRKLVPIAPFHFQNGELKSELIQIVISDLIELLYLIDEDDILRLTKKAASTFPTVHKLDPLEIERSSMDISAVEWEPTGKFKVNGKSFNYSIMAPIEVVNFVKTLPTQAEIGAQFSVHQNNPMFKSAIPLVQRAKTYCAFVRESPQEFHISHFGRNLRRLKSFAYNLMRSAFDEKRFERSLELIYYNLLPQSTVRVDSSCEDGHTKRTFHERYIDGILEPERRSCSQEGCFSPIEHTSFVVSNEKIFNAWEKGALMEWFAASILKRSGLSQVLWNIELSGIQCDAIASQEEEVVVVECKRTDQFGEVYKEGLKQLREIREFLHGNGISTHTILMTTIQGTPRIEEKIDVVITQDNYMDFCKDPLSLV